MLQQLRDTAMNVQVNHYRPTTHHLFNIIYNYIS
jgi:hypothetical protein